MGYNLFKQKKYSQAKEYFKQCETLQNETMKIDAKCRYADCLYMSKDFQSAIKEYDYVISKNKLDADYASYQKGMAYGALGNYDRKISILESALSQFPRSNYVASIKYELANSYLTLDLYPKSLELYTDITKNYSQSIHAKDSYAKIGMIYYNMGKEKDALIHLKKVVETYPGTEEAKSALNNIKTIYIESNNVDEFIAYTKKIPEAEITQSEQDSISYQAIENQYMNGDCQKAIDGFREYISKYPDGAFYASANYYLADCLIKNSQKQEALQAYENIISKPKNEFTEKAILKAANLNFENKTYEKALQEFCLLEQIAEISTHKLQALLGAMECYYLLGKFDSTIITSNKILSLEKTDENISEKASYYLAKSLLKNANSGQAIEEFKKLTSAKNTEYASEAQYTLAEIQYNNGNLEESEKIILEITSNPSSEFWLAKAFILWADIFKERGNKIQAKQTLQSIIDNYEGDQSIINEAQNKLDEINNKHTEEQKLQEQKLQEQKEAVDEIIIENK
jgi:TolA-binding protein